MAKCPFCFKEARLSKEHLFSRPVCRAVGIDRSTAITPFDARSQTIRPPASLSQRTVRLPCEACNSGWMGDLENQMASVLKRWPKNGHTRLRHNDRSVLIRWLAKTTIVLAHSDGKARRFLDDWAESAFPHPLMSRSLGDGEVPENVRIGAARVKSGSAYLYGFGNPTVEVVRPDDANCRTIQIAAFNLGTLQLWCMIPIFRPDSLRWPPNVIELKSGTRSAALRFARAKIDPGAVQASFSAETNAYISAVFAAAPQSEQAE